MDTQEPIVTEDSEPEPDVAVIRGSTDDYATQNPPAVALGLVVEVADESLRRDRDLKSRVYAQAGIACYWIVDVNARSVEVRSEPVGDRYERSTVYTETERVPVTLAGDLVGSVAVALLLPEA